MNKLFIVVSFLFTLWLPAVSADSTVAIFNNYKNFLTLSKFSGPLPTFSYGASASCDNPALLAHLHGHSITTALTDIGNPFYGSISYVGSFIKNATFALANTHYNNNGYTENLSNISYSSSQFGLDFGLNAKFMVANSIPSLGYDSTIFSLDFDAGFIKEFFKRGYVGFTMFNLLATTGRKNHDLEYFNERAFKLQLGSHLDKESKLILFSEARIDSLHDFSLSKCSFGGGFNLSFFSNDLFQLRAGILSSNHNLLDTTSLAITNIGFGGLTFNIPISNHLLKVEYSTKYNTTENLPLDIALTHNIALSFVFSGTEDYIAPIIRVTPDVSYLTPNGDGKHDVVNFIFDAKDNPNGSGIKKWSFTIYTKENNDKLHIIKSFSGSGIPPRAISWDGKGINQKFLDVGTYYYQLRVIDNVHNNSATKLKIIKIN